MEELEKMKEWEKSGSPETEHLPPAKISNCSLPKTLILASRSHSRNPSHPWIFDDRTIGSDNVMC